MSRLESRLGWKDPDGRMVAHHRFLTIKEKQKIHEWRGGSNERCIGEGEDSVREDPIMVCPMIRGTREGHFQGYTCVNIKKKTSNLESSGETSGRERNWESCG
jgi:hypothetical protein